MTNSTKVIIYDTEGNVILNDSVTSPFVGLQAGETFWYGSANNQAWAKIISITYGIDTSSKYFVVEMVVEPTQKKTTKTANPTYKTIDHGEIQISAYLGRSVEWQSKDGEIKFTVSSIGGTYVSNFVGIINSASGPKIERKDRIEVGDFFVVKTAERCVKFTLTFATNGETTHSAKFRITEQIPI